MGECLDTKHGHFVIDVRIKNGGEKIIQNKAQESDGGFKR